MNQIKYLVLALVLTLAAPAQAQNRLSQQDMLTLLARAGTTPEAMGMLPLRVCRVVANSPNEKRVYGKAITSDRSYQQLVRFVTQKKRAEPTWQWSVECFSEFHQLTPQLRATLHASMIARTPAVNLPASPAKVAIKVILNTNAEFRLRVNGQLYSLTGKILAQWLSGAKMNFGGTKIDKFDLS